MKSNTISLIIGLPASGKSTICKKLIDQGSINLNRDLLGGKVADLLPKAESFLERNQSVVLDNIFPTAESRKPFIDLGKRLGARIECYWLKTSIEDAQFNACSRMIKKYGKLLDQTEMKKLKDPNMFPIFVLFKYKKEFQNPDISEGFDSINEIKFNRIIDNEYKNKAVILDYDGTLRDVINTENKYPCKTSEIKILENRKDKLKKLLNEGYILCGASNQSGVDKKILTYDQAVECFEYTNKQLECNIDYMFCPHRSAPISCYCRKPQVGIFVHFMEKYKLNPAKCIMVGDLTSDQTFAKRCGLEFHFANEFFK